MSLWSTVLVYSDPEFAFKLVARPDEVPQHAVGVEEEARTGLSLIQSEWPESFRLINSQLRAMVEKRAEKLAKGILVDLERRLIQKPEENRYHTFVAAVVLLNCVERASFVYGKKSGRNNGLWPLTMSSEDYGPKERRLSEYFG